MTNIDIIFGRDEDKQVFQITSEEVYTNYDPIQNVWALMIRPFPTQKPMKKLFSLVGLSCVVRAYSFIKRPLIPEERRCIFLNYSTYGDYFILRFGL